MTYVYIVSRGEVCEGSRVLSVHGSPKGAMDFIEKYFASIDGTVELDEVYDDLNGKGIMQWWLNLVDYISVIRHELGA